MYQIKMVGKNALIYSDEKGILKNFSDIEGKLKKMAEQFVIESISIDNGVKLNASELALLNDGYLLKKIDIHAQEIEAKNNFIYEPLPVYEIYEKVFSVIAKNPKGLLFCAIPAAIICIFFSLLLSITESPQPNIQWMAPSHIGLTIIGSISLLSLGYLKTLTNLHSHFLSGGEQKNFLTYLLISKQDLSFLFYTIIISLRVAILMAVFLAALMALTIAIGANGTIIKSAYILFPGTLLLTALSLYFESRYIIALPAIINNKKNCRTSWSYTLTKNNGWRITFLIFLFPAMIESLLHYVPFLNNNFIIKSLFRLIYLSISVGMIVYCYRHLTGLQEKQQESVIT